MKKHTSLLMISFIVLAITCKKSNSNSGGSGSGGGSTSGAGFTNVYGSLIAQKILTNNIISGVPDTTYTCNAYFFNASQNNWVFWNPTVTTGAGTVTINATGLKLYTVGVNIYIDTTATLNLKSGATWQVTGLGSIPAFSYSPALTWPSYTGYNVLPDTIKKSQSNTILFSGITGADSVNVTINDGSFLSGHSSTSNRVTASATSVTFSSSLLAGFNTTTNGNLQLEVYKFAPIQAVGGKNFVFVYTAQFRKKIVVIN